MSNKDQLILRTPKQLDFPNPEAILNLNELKQWLDSLPLLKPSETINELLDAITAINQQPLNPKKRRLLLDEFRQVLITIYPSLNLDALKRLSIKETDSDQLQLQTSSLFMGLSDGYKIIVKNALENRSALKQDVLLAPLYHALEAASLALLNGYRSYKTAPEFLYQDTHQLYLLAEHSGLLDHELEDILQSPCANNIGSLYKQTMILSYLDPFRMPSGIAEKLYDRLSGFSKHCTILPDYPRPETLGVFVIDLSSDKAPQALFKISANTKPGIPRIFSTQTMINKLQAEIALLQAQEQGLSTSNEIELLNRLMPASQEQVTRKSERVDSDRNCKVTFGIDAVNHFLSLGQQELEQLITLPANSLGSYELEPWTITNESETGLSLSNQQISRCEVSVGDIIGLLLETTAQDQQNGKIAIIRWIRNDQKNHINIGIEFISGNSLPATGKLTDTEDNSNVFNAIFISSTALNDIPATILTPKKVYRRGRIMDLSIGGQPLRIKAGFLRDDTFTFDRFDFTSLS